MDAGDEEFVALDEGPVDGGVPPYLLTRNRLIYARDTRLALGLRFDARCQVARELPAADGYSTSG